MRSKPLILAALLSGCASGDPPAKPDLGPLAVAADSRLAAASAAAGGGERAPAAWWRAFGDRDLDGLVARALRENPDLAAAAARVRESRAAVIAADADLLPRLDAQLALASRRISNQTGQNFPGLPRRSDVGSAGIQLSWEVDLWDRAGAAARGAVGEAEAAAFSAAAAEVTLAASVARAWFAVRLAREQHDCLRGDFELRMADAELVQRKHAAGLADDDALASARLAAAQAKADQLDAARRLAAAENAVRVLVALPPGAPLPAAASDPDGEPALAQAPAFGAGVPSGLLLSRPDILAAERRIDAALAREGAARADFYPRLTLVGDAGWAADPAGNLGRAGSGFWSVTPSLSLPILEGSRNEANLEQARARAEAAAADYRRVVLNAFREVDDALSDLRDVAQQEDLARRVFLAVRERLANARRREAAGLADSLEVSAARRDQHLARRTLAAYAWERRQAAVRLAAATGGGFGEAR